MADIFVLFFLTSKRWKISSRFFTLTSLTSMADSVFLGSLRRLLLVPFAVFMHEARSENARTCDLLKGIRGQELIWKMFARVLCQ